MKDDILIQKALESYRRELLEDADNIIINRNGNTTRYIHNELTRILGIVDKIEDKLNTEYPTWDDIPF